MSSRGIANASVHLRVCIIEDIPLAMAELIRIRDAGGIEIGDATITILRPREAPPAEPLPVIGATEPTIKRSSIASSTLAGAIATNIDAAALCRALNIDPAKPLTRNEERALSYAAMAAVERKDR